MTTQRSFSLPDAEAGLPLPLAELMGLTLVMDSGPKGELACGAVPLSLRLASFAAPPSPAASGLKWLAVDRFRTLLLSS